VKKTKIFFSIAAVLTFAFFVLGTSVWRIQAQSSVFDYRILTLALPTPQPTSAPSPTPTVDYYLPYPGILPDNMLYPLKMARDRVWLFLTIDPLKKGEKLLLFSDKRLGAGKTLIEGGKVELGISTITKGEKYLEEAIAQAERARKKGKETTALYEKLEKATLKHQEILTEVLPKVPPASQEDLKRVLDYALNGHKAVVKALGEMGIRGTETGK